MVGNGASSSSNEECLLLAEYRMGEAQYRDEDKQTGVKQWQGSSGSIEGDGVCKELLHGVESVVVGQPFEMSENAARSGQKQGRTRFVGL